MRWLSQAATTVEHLDHVEVLNEEDDATFGNMKGFFKAYVGVGDILTQIDSGQILIAGAGAGAYTKNFVKPLWTEDVGVWRVKR